MAAWFERDPALLETVRQQVAATGRPLFVAIEDGTAFVRGAIAVTDPTGGIEAERFSIEVELAADHPDGVPIVRETDGRIPRIADRHLNRDGSACVFVIDERWKAWPPGGTLTDFINGPVYHFFVWQAGVELSGTPPFAARPHRDAGVRDFYEEAAQSNDPVIVLSFLLRLGEKSVDPGEACYCRSRLALRDCHFSRTRLFRSRVSRKRAHQALSTLSDQLVAEAKELHRRGGEAAFNEPPPARSLQLTLPPVKEAADELDRLRSRRAWMSTQPG